MSIKKYIFNLLTLFFHEVMHAEKNFINLNEKNDLNIKK